MDETSMRHMGKMPMLRKKETEKNGFPPARE